MTDFGSDLSCVIDLTADMRELSGTQGWLESLARRLQGPLFYDPEYGYDILDRLDDEIRLSDLDGIARDVDDEFLKDPRTLSSSSDVANTNSNGAVTIKITSRVRSALGPFTLVLSVSQVTVQILSITPG